MSDISSDITAARQKLQRLLQGRPGFVGTAIEAGDDGRPTVAVHVADEQSQEGLPPTIDGQKIRYRVTGPFKSY